MKIYSEPKVNLLMINVEVHMTASSGGILGEGDADDSAGSMFPKTISRHL